MGVLSRSIIWCALAGLIAGASSGSAAEIEVLRQPSVKLPLVSLRGEIVEGDARKFSTAVEGLEDASIVLNSPGGLVREALEIGAIIRLEGFTTLVAEEQKCFSACGLIWVSGVRRYMSRTSLIGFHAAYKQENGEYTESGVANAEIGSFLTHLGLRIEAIRYFTFAGPDDFLLLTPDRARALGIEVYTVDGSDVTTPAATPTVDTYADRFVSYSLLQSRCGSFLLPDTSVLKAEQQDAFTDGNAMVSGEIWVNLWTPLLETLKSRINEEGVLLVCIETEARLRKQGQRTGISGPNFECGAAATPTELAICRDPTLWAKDRAIGAIYVWVRDNVEKAVRRRLLAVQREWLKHRNQCGGDVQCLTEIYDQRLSELRAIDLPN